MSVQPGVEHGRWPRPGVFFSFADAEDGEPAVRRAASGCCLLGVTRGALSAGAGAALSWSHASSTRAGPTPARSLWLLEPGFDGAAAGDATAATAAGEPKPSEDAGDSSTAGRASRKRLKLAPLPAEEWVDGGAKAEPLAAAMAKPLSSGSPAAAKLTRLAARDAGSSAGGSNSNTDGS